ncbi:MAG: hypothetical protein NUV34_00305, partial [Sulfuricaulis sp.]|nr:hypothetical protein [Sulfuricaulis sp.]
MLHEKLRNVRVVRKDVRGPGLDLSEHLRVKVFDGIRHIAMFAYLRTLVNLSLFDPDERHHTSFTPPATEGVTPPFLCPDSSVPLDGRREREKQLWDGVICLPPSPTGNRVRSA